VPLPTAFAAAVMAGLFGMAYLGFDSLNGAIADLRDDMNTQIGRLDAKIDELRGDMDAEIGALRGEVGAILLDHTDRLARIETHLEIIRRPERTEPAEPAH